MTEQRWGGRYAKGWMTNVDCPHRFCDGKIVYNGNYFCECFGDTCNFALEQDEYEQVYRRGEWVDVLVYAAPPLHKKMWEKIKADVGIQDE